MTLDDARRRAEHLVRRYAATGPYRLVDDALTLRTIVRGLAGNWHEHGLPYCPCKDLSGDRSQDRALVCPCRAHHDEISQTGACCCGLFQKRSD